MIQDEHCLFCGAIVTPGKFLNHLNNEHQKGVIFDKIPTTEAEAAVNFRSTNWQ